MEDRELEVSGRRVLVSLRPQAALETLQPRDGTAVPELHVNDIWQRITEFLPDYPNWPIEDGEHRKAFVVSDYGCTVTVAVRPL